MEKLEKERLAKELAKKRKQLGISKRDFAQRMGVDEKTIYNWEHNGNIPETKLKQIESFINGEADINDNMVSTSEGVPFFNVDFELGFDLMVNDQTTVPEYFINFAPYNRCTAWCTVSGNSMYPTIASGDMVALSRIEDFRYLISGEVYAFVTANGLRTIKRVKDNGDTFTLIPDNKEYPEQTLPKSEFTHVFRVNGTMKRF